jgi:hypothetical protein
MPLIWSRGSLGTTLSARHTFLGLTDAPKQYLHGSDSGRYYHQTYEFPSGSHPRFWKKKTGSNAPANQFTTPYFPSALTQMRTQRLPGWAGGPSFYIPSRKTYAPTSTHSPYLSTVKQELSHFSSGFLGDVPRSPTRTPARTPARSPSHGTPRIPAGGSPTQSALARAM